MPISDSNKSYFDDQLASADVLNHSGVQGSITVGTSAVEARVGSTRLEGRKVVTIYNNSNNTIYYGFDSSVTTSNGTPIVRGQFAQFNVGDNLPIFLIAGTTGNNVRITEAG